jgi:hypothetical protein
MWILQAEQRGARPTRVPPEGAEPTAIYTNVGVVDVAVHVEEDPAAVDLLIYARREFPYGRKVVRLEQGKCIGLAEPFSGQDLRGDESKGVHRGSGEPQGR